jgi:hypothetical protein
MESRRSSHPIQLNISNVRNSEEEGSVRIIYTEPDDGMDITEYYLD